MGCTYLKLDVYVIEYFRHTFSSELFLKIADLVRVVIVADTPGRHWMRK